MRRHLFLVVLLSLVVNLSKGIDNTETATATPELTTPTATEDNTETATATPELTTPTATEDNTETATATPELTTPTATEDNTETATATPELTTPITTEDNTETATATPELTTPITTEDLCNPNPCGTYLAKCIALNSTFTCQCPYGFYYRDKNCHQGKIFPGVISLSQSYSGSFPNVNSKEYEEMFQNITMFFNEAFIDLKGFEQTVIVKIESAEKVRSSLSTNLTVINLFMENTTAENDTVSLAIKKATEKSTFVSYYRGASYCEGFNCDTRTTECKENIFPTCECKSDFSRTEWDVLSCSDCSKDCSGEENKYCAKEEGVPKCKCMPDFEKKNEKCVSCPVGYSGENCSNNRELILIIVGTVFGAVILSLVVAVSVVSVRAKHKQDPEKRSLINQGYSNPNASDGRQTTMFPRVQTTSGHGNPGYQPNNPYEKRSANRGHFLERDYDDMYEASREPEGFRMQNRY